MWQSECTQSRTLCQTVFVLAALLCFLTACTAQTPVWTTYGQGYHLDPQVQHGGTPSLRCRTTGGGQTSGAMTVCTLNQTRALPVLVTGWSKAQAVDGVADNDYSIYVDITYTDSTSLWGQTAPFETGSHDWQARRLMLFPSKPIRFMNVYALLRNHTGTAWFASFDAREVKSDALFDSQNIKPPVLPKHVQSGWFVRDVAAGTPLQPVTPGQTMLGLRLDTLKTAPNGSITQSTIRNLTTHDRAITIYYVERFAASNPVWWNNIRDGVPATESREYAQLTQAGAGATGQLSLYPFGCVTGRGAGLALGIPPALGPRVFRIAFRPDTHLLFLACDLALTKHGDPAHHDSAPIAVARYKVDPGWGFRDAAAKFYALFPDSYKRRAKAEGIWMPFTDPSKVAGLADFQFAYHEGDNSIASDRQNNILSFKYVEPMTYWMPMTKDTPRTYVAALAQINTLAVTGDEVDKRQAQAVLSSGSQDVRGQFNVAFRDTPWCDGAVWVLNPNPRVNPSSRLWTKARLNSAGEPVPGAPNQPDGEYLDSLEAWADVLDYRPESLAASPNALCFATGQTKPALPTWFSVYASTAALSQNLHRHGALLMANSVPWRFTAFAPLLDIMGTETSMFTDTGAWSPEPDAVMDLRRTASYHKPYLLLLNTDFSKVDSAKIERYFQRCLFYGIYPSMFSANASDHPYWENPSLYNRDRPLFQKYIPVVQKLSAAGWEPITWARSGNPDVWLERFGKSYLSVLNSKDAPATAVIQVDSTRFFPNADRAKTKLAVYDVFSGQNIALMPLGTANLVSMTLGGQETRVLSLRLVTPLRSAVNTKKRTNE
ncbi:MAG: hypothetical protein ACRYFS_12805 [Janthinobacterium lividum]